MKKNLSKVFMAFATGSESTEGMAVKRYLGVAPVYVLAVNPTKTELEKLYDTTLEKSPEYLTTGKVGDKEVPQLRLDFIVKTDAEKANGIELVTKISFFLKKEWRYNNDQTKVQVINKYGESTWLTIEDAKNGVIPENQQWFDASDIRPAYIGEEELTMFLKAYLNIPNKSYRKKDGEVVTLKNPADAEARLEKIAEYFKGDISELRSVVALQPNNKVKVAFGVKTTDDNKMYQDVFTQRFLKNSINDYSRLDAEIKESKNSGRYPNTEFSVGNLREYSVEATSFEKEDTAPSSAPNGWFNA